MKKAAETLKRVTKLREQGKASDQAVAEAALGYAMAKANLASAAQSAAGTAADAAKTTETLGFYGEAGFTAETTRHAQTSQSVESKGSTVTAAGDIELTSGGDTNQTGSLVLSKNGDISYNVGGDLNFTAAANKNTSKNTSETSAASIGISSKGEASVNASHANQSSSSQSTEYINAATVAKSGRIEYTVGNDMNASGYNALAETVTANIGGNLTLASLQNTDSTSGRSDRFGGGYSSGGRISANAGFTRDKSDRAWVDDITSIIGTNGVEITVGDTLTLTGAKIANENDGVDGGNLTISTKHLDASDIWNHDYSESYGFNVGTNIGDSKTDTGHPTGSTTVGINHAGHETDGVTRATIGQGTLDIADGSGGSVNRDINAVDIVVRDKTTGAIDATLTVDHRLFSEEGRKQIADEIANAPENLKTIAEDVGKTLKVATDSAVKTLTEVAKALKPAERTKLYADVISATICEDYRKNALEIKEFPDITDLNSALKAANDAKEHIKSGKATQEDIDRLVAANDLIVNSPEFMSYKEEVITKYLEAMLDRDTLSKLQKAQKTNDAEDLKTAANALSSSLNQNVDFAQNVTVEIKETYGKDPKILGTYSPKDNSVNLFLPPIMTSKRYTSSFEQIMATFGHEVMGHAYANSPEATRSEYQYINGVNGINKNLIQFLFRRNLPPDSQKFNSSFQPAEYDARQSEKVWMNNLLKMMNGNKK